MKLFFLLTYSQLFPIPFHRKRPKENCVDEKGKSDEKDIDGTYGSNSRTCSEAVGMEKLIPSLRQRQQIGNPINILPTRRHYS